MSVAKLSVPEPSLKSNKLFPVQLMDSPTVEGKTGMEMHWRVAVVGWEDGKNTYELTNEGHERGERVKQKTRVDREGRGWEGRQLERSMFQCCPTRVRAVVVCHQWSSSRIGSEPLLVCCGGGQADGCLQMTLKVKNEGLPPQDKIFVY